MTDWIEPPLEQWERESHLAARLAVRLRDLAREGRPIPETLRELAPLMLGMTKGQIREGVEIARAAAALPELVSDRNRRGGR